MRNSRCPVPGAAVAGGARAGALPARPTAPPQPRAGPGAASGGPGERRPRGGGCGLGVRAAGSYTCVGHLDAPGSSWLPPGAAVGSWARAGPRGARWAWGVRRYRRWPVPTKAPCCAGRTRTIRAQGWCHFPQSLRHHGRLSFSQAQPGVSQKAWRASAVAEGREPCRGAWLPGHRRGVGFPRKSF